MRALEPFDPLVARWFSDALGRPTPAQEEAWRAIAPGGHVLVSAPTGTGKTLAAFLWALERLLTGAWEGGTTRVLYISPLKALGEDIRRNLEQPLAELQQTFADALREPCPVRVGTRHGDTPAGERRRLVRRPPEILVTTPESLNLLLTSGTGRVALSGVRCVILDEIHAVVAGKRGTWLMSGVERLVDLAGEFQRIALSATVAAKRTVAAFIGGWDANGQARSVRIVHMPAQRVPQLRVAPIVGREARGEADAFYRALADALRPRIAACRTTLIFVNSRRMAEKVARFLNAGLDAPIAYAHHGSLAKELRRSVEQRLKRGELPAVVATGSLELGIDIGSCDQVLFVQSPRTVHGGLQRIGRAAHRVDGVSRGSIHPTHGQDLLEAAVMAPLIVDGAVEAQRPVRAPLDVLAQIVISMVIAGTAEPDDLFAAVRRAWPYRTLSRSAFDLVVRMLCGRHGLRRLRDASALLSQDPEQGRLSPAPGAARVFYLNAGVIPDRGYVSVVRGDTGVRLGELDEEFVWERSVGDAITIGTRTWRVARLSHDRLEVEPGSGPGALAPFWRAEAQDRDRSTALALGAFLERIDTLGADAVRTELVADHACDPEAAAQLAEFLARQRQCTRALPHRHRLIVEHCPDMAGEGHLVILHLAWGARVLRPWAIALGAAWRRRYGSALSCEVTDTCLLAHAPEAVDERALLALVDIDNLNAHLQRALEGSGVFGTAFRENAGRALLLPRRDPRRRLPLWVVRERAKRLLQQVRQLSDFPILAETWRSCLEDGFDLPGLRSLLGELSDGRITVETVHTAHPSPFVADLVFRRVNRLMYLDDQPLDDSASRLRGDVVRAVVHEPRLRPAVSATVLADLRARLYRLLPGYAPRDAPALIAAIEERLALPWAQWRELLAAMRRDHDCDPAQVVERVDGRLVALLLPGARESLVCTIAGAARLLRVRDCPATGASVRRPGVAEPGPPVADPTFAALRRQLAAAASEDDLATCLVDWLAWQAPLPLAELAAIWGLVPSDVEALLGRAIAAGEVITDLAVTDAPELRWAHAENVERALRLRRVAARARLAPLPLAQLPLLLATWQGVIGQRAADPQQAVRDTLEPLFGHCARAGAWERELLPARLPDYTPQVLDRLCGEGPLCWFGCGRERISLAFRDAVALFNPHGARMPGADLVGPVFPVANGRFDFATLLAHSGMDSRALSELLWQRTWKGQVANDAFAAVRRGLASGFAAVPVGAAGGHARFGSWQASRPFAGAWYLLHAPGPESDDGDLLDAVDYDRERVRVLLRRFGVLSRDLVRQELAPLRWARLLPAIRLMELAGEVVTGEFIAGLPGLQVAHPQLPQLIARGLDRSAVWMVNARDPAAGCGLRALGLDLPARVAGTHIVFRGERPVLISQRSGATVQIALPPDDPDLPRVIAPLRRLVQRAVDPLRRLAVARINDRRADESPYAAALTAVGFERAYPQLELRRSYDV